MTGMRSLFVLAMLSAQGAMAAENEPPQVTPQLRQRAEDLAGAASKRFSDILDDEQRVAQAQPDTPSTQRGTFAPVWEWLARSSQVYDEVVIAQLKNKDGWTVVVQRNGEAAPRSGADARTACASGAAARVARMDRPRGDGARLAGARQPLVSQRDRQAAARAEPAGCAKRARRATTDCAGTHGAAVG